MMLTEYRTKKLGFKYPVFFVASALFSLCVLQQIGYVFNYEEVNKSGRHLLWLKATANCTPASVHDFPEDAFSTEQRASGAILLHVFLACYIFVLLAFVCDDYFVPSIKTLCDRLQMSEDVAGVTFMAAATSSPELFINIVGTFITEGDIGVGTIVGSAVFNILAVPACCGLLAGRKVLVEWIPLTRDCAAYGATVLILIFVLRNGRVEWYESLVMVTLYILYITAIFFNDTSKKVCQRRKPFTEVKQGDIESQPLLQDNKIPANSLTMKFTETQPSTSTKQNEVLEENEKLEELDDILFDVPDGFFAKFFFFITWPIAFILSVTVPDCRRRTRLWPVTFVMCIIWIASTSYLVSWMITIVGDTLHIPDSVMGLTLLAAGMSVPEAASSVIVTNQGHGSMGISSSIGSNTFDILLCLGFPWLIKSSFYPAQEGVHAVFINSEGLEYNSVLLLTTLLLLYLSFVLNKFILDRKIGLITLAIYLAFLILSTMVELNMFGVVNLPSCPS